MNARLKSLLTAYVSHMRAARRERQAGNNLNAIAWTETATVYRNAYVRESLLSVD